MDAKIKEIGQRALEKIYKLLYGTGIGKIPGVSDAFVKLANVLYGAVEMDGQKLKYDSSFGIHGMLKIIRGEYEPEVTSLFCSLIRKGMTIFDIGAGVGYYTLLAAKRVGDDGLVVAFEPNPRLFELLVENVKINGWKNVKVIQSAVSDMCTKVLLNIPRVGSSGSSISPTVSDKRIVVKSISLDEFLQQHEDVSEIDLIKMDIEGGEVRAIKGMKEVIKKFKPIIICEIHPKQINAIGDNIRDINNILFTNNYEKFLILNHKLVKSEIKESSGRHYLFIHQEKIKNLKVLKDWTVSL